MCMTVTFAQKYLGRRIIMFILIDIFGREFEFGNTDPLVIYNTDGNPIDVNRDPIFQSQLIPDLIGSQLIKYVPQSEETKAIPHKSHNPHYTTGAK